MGTAGGSAGSPSDAAGRPRRQDHAIGWPIVPSTSLIRMTDKPVRDFDHRSAITTAADTSYICRPDSTIPQPSRPGHFNDHQPRRSPAFPDHPQDDPRHDVTRAIAVDNIPLTISINDRAASCR